MSDMYSVYKKINNGIGKNILQEHVVTYFGMEATEPLTNMLNKISPNVNRVCLLTNEEMYEVVSNTRKFVREHRYSANTYSIVQANIFIEKIEKVLDDDIFSEYLIYLL